MPKSAGFLYLNFERNRKRLEEQLHGIRHIHGKQLFPTLHRDTNILDYFVESAFEYDTTGTFFLSNTSLKPNRYKITLRPAATEVLTGEFPPGVTLCLRGVLMPPHHSSPEVLVERIIDIGASGKRPFEVEISATSQPASSHRPKNVLTEKRLSKIPEISRQTREQLKDWKEYLQWRREIIEQELTGLRYVSVKVADQRIIIRVVAKHEKDFYAAEKSLRRDEALLFPLNYSTNDWQFSYNREAGYLNPVPLGKLLKSSFVDDGIIADRLKCPWVDPYVVDLEFEIASASALNSRRTPEFDDQGFVATSLIGDLTVLQRQASAIFELELQSGYAPFLSSWLFDIEAANTPQIAAPIDDWQMPSINDDQRQAVRKILEAPDVTLIQGPPGTGKTTVIAEAIFQLTRQGKRVLLASQANLAVDNALEKISFTPQIRPVRLGRSSKFSVGGQQFAEDAVLQRFYATVADACESRHLQGDSSDESVDNLRKSLEAMDALQESMSQIQQQIADVGKSTAVNGTAHSAKPVTDDKVFQLRSLRLQLSEIVNFLNGQRNASPVLPLALEKVINAAILAPLNGLRRYKIDLSSDRENQFSIVYRNFLNLRPRMTTLRTLLKQLQDGASHVMISPENREQALQLRHNIDQVEERMEAGEEGLQDDWRRMRHNLRRLHDTSRLDGELFEAIFNQRDKGIVFAKRLLNPKIERQKLISFLEHTLQGYSNVVNQVNKAVPLIVRNIGRLAGQLSALESEHLQVLKESEAQKADSKRDELQQTLQEQQAALQEQLQQLDIDDNAENLTPEAALANAREQLQARIDANKNDNELRPDTKWKEFLSWWTDLLKSPQQAENDEQEVLPLYLQSSNVVGITCNENRKLLEDRGFSRFDVTIIDEVSKATPPELLMPMMLGKKTVLVGDHRQLPPVFKEQQGSWLESIEEPENSRIASLMTVENYEKFRQMVTASLFKQHFESAPSSIKTTLYTQYRMHPDIMQVVNPFYHYHLKCGLDKPREMRNHRLSINTSDDLPLLTPDTHTLWIDSGRDPHQKPHYERQSGTSKINLLEIELIIAFLHKLNTAAEKAGHSPRNPKEVGAISFYGRQVWQLRQRVRQENLPALQVEVNTVDRFQGKEKDIIIVSLVRNPRSPAAINNAFVTRFERINVAFSRARELLVIFGSRQMFSQCEVPIPHPDNDGFETKKVYGEIIENLNRASHLWTSGSLIPAAEYQQTDNSK